MFFPGQPDDDVIGFGGPASDATGGGRVCLTRLTHQSVLFGEGELQHGGLVMLKSAHLKTEDLDQIVVVELAKEFGQRSITDGGNIWARAKPLLVSDGCDVAVDDQDVPVYISKVDLGDGSESRPDCVIAQHDLVVRQGGLPKCTTSLSRRR